MKKKWQHLIAQLTWRREGKKSIFALGCFFINALAYKGQIGAMIFRITTLNDIDILQNDT
jgi:hypothetical protein